MISDSRLEVTETTGTPACASRDSWRIKWRYALPIKNIERARKTAVILAFMVGAAALLGAAVAWFAACAGGRDRDDSVRSILYGWWHTSVAVRR
jgi:hypothetical protein